MRAGAASGCRAPAREPRCVRACFLSITLQNKLLPTTLDMQKLSFSSWLVSRSPRLFLQKEQKIPIRFPNQGSVPWPLKLARIRNARLPRETRCPRLPAVLGPAAVPVPLKSEDSVPPAVPSSVLGATSAAFGITQTHQRARPGPLGPECPQPSPSVGPAEDTAPGLHTPLTPKQRKGNKTTGIPPESSQQGRDNGCSCWRPSPRARSKPRAAARARPAPCTTSRGAGSPHGSRESGAGRGHGAAGIPHPRAGRHAALRNANRLLPAR